MTNTRTFKAQSFYIAYAPDNGLWAAGRCFEEAVNSLSDQLRSSGCAAEKGTDHEKQPPAVTASPPGLGGVD
jgi:hypothetical protein